jgi:hypothetical protein
MNEEKIFSDPGQKKFHSTDSVDIEKMGGAAAKERKDTLHDVLEISRSLQEKAWDSYLAWWE